MRPWVRSSAAARGGGDPDDADRAPGPEQRESTAGGPPPTIVPRWVQMVLLPVALLALWALARAAGSVLLILIAAAVVALILSPPVGLLERWLPRGLAILLTYIAGFALIAGIAILLAAPVATQVARLEHNFPEIVRHANHQLDDFQRWLTRHGIDVHIRHQGQTALQTLQKDVLKRSGDIVAFSRSLLSGVVTIGFDLILTLVLSIYLLVYGRQIGALVRSLMPAGDGSSEDDYPRLVQQAVSGYVRGQLLFSLVMGASAGVSLEVLGLVGVFPAGRDYAIFFGAFYGLMELIPYIGPIIGPAPAVIVGLFQSPITALWLVALFVALQQLEGHVVAPQVFGISLRVNPILIILALLIGYQLYGIAGALVALPVVSVLRTTAVYLRRHMVLEPWTVGGGGLGLLSAPPGGRCPECGAVVGSESGDECGVCGASLRSPAPTPK